MSLDVKRGDIFYIAPYYAVGSEQHSGRPAIIVSNDMNNKYSETFEVVFLTTKEKPPLPTHVKILSTPRESIALCEQIDTVAKERIGDYYGSISESEMEAINKALAESINIPHEIKVCDDLEVKLDAAEKRYKRLRTMYDDLMQKFIEGETEAN